MARTTTLNELAEALSRGLGAWIFGTVGSLCTDTVIHDPALAGWLLEDDAYLGAMLRVFDSVGAEGERRRITGYTQGSLMFEVSPALNATPSAGEYYEVYLRTDWDGYTDAINQAIKDASPELFQPRLTSANLTASLEFTCTSDVDDVLGLEVSAKLAGEGYIPVPVDAYTVRDTADGDKQIAFQRVLSGATGSFRIHYKRYYQTLSWGSATELDSRYILAGAEARIRRHLAGDVAGNLVSHHLELMVDAEELAARRKAELITSLATGLGGGQVATPPKRRR